MSKLVICERAENCNNSGCSYKTPTPGSTMYKAMCGHVSTRVDIIEYNEVAVSDPNYLFRRKKNGL